MMTEIRSTWSPVRVAAVAVPCRKPFNTSMMHGCRMTGSCNDRMRTICTIGAGIQRSMHIVRALGGEQERRKKVVFLGTPDVAAGVLEDLIQASCTDSFDIAAVVTQPGRPKGRRNKGVPQPSPVQVCALEHGIHEDAIFCPVKASEKEFISAMKDISPDLCVTAAYGNYLPTSFLEIPVHGTLNIHPSLLPLYRGAAPVQRSLEDGVTTTGVSVLFTVKAMDAGPILAQREYSVADDVQAPELLDTLFRIGTETLVECLPSVWSGDAERLCVAQDESKATHAAKLERSEAQLDFSASAWVCHNKVRGFAGWPGTHHPFRVVKTDSGAEDVADIKVLRTRVRTEPVAEDIHQQLEQGKVVFNGSDAMMVMCGQGEILEILELQNPGKKATNAQAFQNGLAGKALYVPKE